MKLVSKIRRVVFSPLALIMAAVIVLSGVPVNHVSAASSVTVKLGSNKSVTLKKGSKKQIIVKKGSKTLGKKAVKYSSNQKSVATVSASGMITAKKAGTAKITVKKGSKKSVITVKVKAKSDDDDDDDDDDDKITGIFLTESEIRLKVGCSKELSCKALPSKKVITASWDVADESVATYENGKVVAKSVGETLVSASAHGKTTVCKVIVYE